MSLSKTWIQYSSEEECCLRASNGSRFPCRRIPHLRQQEEDGEQPTQHPWMLGEVLGDGTFRISASRVDRRRGARRHT